MRKKLFCTLFVKCVEHFRFYHGIPWKTSTPEQRTKVPPKKIQKMSESLWDRNMLNCIYVSLPSTRSNTVWKAERKWQARQTLKILWESKSAHSLTPILLDPPFTKITPCVWSTFRAIVFSNLPNITEIFLYTDCNFIPLSDCDRSQ